MRPIPATRLGDSHGLLRAIERRGRLRTDEFVTEFNIEELFPPDLENALGRMRHFISYARAAGLVKEDRGVVELTDVGRRYVRAGDDNAPYDVSPQQAEWLRRQLREKHMTDSIFHGLAIGLSLLASTPPGTNIATLDFGRSMAYLGRAGWDNENTLEIQGERHLTLLRDMELVDADRRLTMTGDQLRGELTLPVHMSLVDIAAQLNPGGADAVRAAAEEEFGGEPEPEPPPPPEVAETPEPEEEEDDDDNGYHTAFSVGAVKPPGEPAPQSRPPVVPRAHDPHDTPTMITPGSSTSVPPPASPPPEAPPPAAPSESVPPPAASVAPPSAAPPDVFAPSEPEVMAPPDAGVPPEYVAPPVAAPSEPEVMAPPDAGVPPEFVAPPVAAPDVVAPAVPPEPPAAAPSEPEVVAPPHPGVAPESTAPPVGPPAAAAPPDTAVPPEPAAPPMAEPPAVAAPDAGVPAESVAPPVAAPDAAAPAVPPEPAAPPMAEPPAVAPPEAGVPAESVAPPPHVIAPAEPAPPAASVPDAAPPPVVVPPPPSVAPAPPDLGAAAESVARAVAAAPEVAPPAAAEQALLGTSGFVSAASVRAVAEESGLRLPNGVYANVAAALSAGKHLLLTGAPGSGKTTLALAVARVAAQAGRARGATLMTASAESGSAALVDAARKGKWVVLDELDRADPERLLGGLSTFLAGLPVVLPDGEEVAPPGEWRIVATWGGEPPVSARVLRRFAAVEVAAPPADVLRDSIRAATGNDATAAAAAERLLALAGVAPLGAGVFLDAARHAAARNAAAAADEATLAREAYAAYIAPLLGDLDEDAAQRLRELLRGLTP